MTANLTEIVSNNVYGESLHSRGENLTFIEKIFGEGMRLPSGFDAGAGRVFRQELRNAGLSGVWWPESK